MSSSNPPGVKPSFRLVNEGPFTFELWLEPFGDRLAFPVNAVFEFALEPAETEDPVSLPQINICGHKISVFALVTAVFSVAIDTSLSKVWP